ncbi:VPA1262 family N-terminal domain-containing protein [Xanthomonas sp. LF07-6]|uniref:VPA1262 family N-terminal domain-containing protein n=1 Tax=Xanthomonas sp. LF07-6 TaxID=3097550 RepID=UPI002A8352BF|nr:VPA1262 family N-terminal domain-containing protein [Xanthomonas sp. LF07-6]MDY4339833.1 VPA1262 family N-terminal domain-containing protein [Xanthomonas sp. LF07-6]
MKSQEQGVIAAEEHQEWAVIRLVTIGSRNEIGRLLFATVTELASDRPAPAAMRGVNRFEMKKGGEKLNFRRTVLAKHDAIRWYRSLEEGTIATPVPTRPEDREKYDGLSMRVTRLDDSQPWPNLGLPIREEFFGPEAEDSSNPAPFLGSVPSRLHRRFGDRAGFESFLGHGDAQAFVARRMHVNLGEYPEYLSSAVYIAPDPVIRQIDSFMVPPRDGYGERIVHRFVPHAGQRLDGVRITAFDKEARLLTHFETISVPADGIVELDKGTCMGQYGFVVTHERHGVLAYQPFVSFVRQMHLNMYARSATRRVVRVPLGDAENAPVIEYSAAPESSLASASVFGEPVAPSTNERVEREARMRERRAEARRLGQRWFPEGSRAEAAGFVQGLLRGARSRVVIADPYLSTLQLGQFLYAVHGSTVGVTLLTTKLAFTPNPSRTRSSMLQAFKDSLKDLQKHQKLTPRVHVIPASSLHDRFLVVDDEVWLIGNSLNALGEKASMVVRLPYPDEVIERLQGLITGTPDLDAYIGQVANATGGSEE